MYAPNKLLLENIIHRGIDYLDPDQNTKEYLYYI